MTVGDLVEIFQDDPSNWIDAENAIGLVVSISPTDPEFYYDKRSVSVLVLGELGDFWEDELYRVERMYDESR